MKRILSTILVCAVTGVASAQTITNTYTVTPTVPYGVIPDGNPVGLAEQFTVSSVPGSISDIQINLNITGGFNGDLYAYLAGPQGQTAILLNRVGVTGSNPYGYSDSGMDITLDGLAVNNIHDYQTVPGYSLSGTTWAADGRNIDPQTAGATLDAAPTTDGLGVFQNTYADGVWTLFIADLVPGGGTASLNSAVLTIMTVPEPSAWVMFGAGMTMLLVIRHWKVGRQPKAGPHKK